MLLTIDKNSSDSLMRQIYGQIKSMILEGRLPADSKLPSTRWLAKDLGISRNVILEAYDQLMAEGYIEGIHGSGTVVAKDIYFEKSKIVHEENLLEAEGESFHSDVIDFRSGIPALDLFPRKEWGRLYNNICSHSSSETFRYCEPAGSMELRQALSRYLYRVRGICCSPEQIMIVSGATQGLSLISKVLYKPGAEVIVEDPLHPGLLNVILSNNYSINPIQADSSGMKTDMLKIINKAGFIYVTPSHQFPLGGILPIQRRIELVKFAQRNDCYIIEDDYDSEYRFEGAPISSLYELEPSKVIYIGSLSKILAPAIRLGYMILPYSLIPRYLKAKMYSDVHTETLTQVVLAQFINDGKLEKHVWKMKKEYLKKRQAVIDNLNINFLNKYTVKGYAAGLHLIAEFDDVIFTEELLSRFENEKVKVYPVESYAINKGSHCNKILLGYGHLSIEEIKDGIGRIKAGINMGTK